MSGRLADWPTAGGSWISADTIAVDYVLVKAGTKLRAWDVRTDGVGLVENYRTMFNKIIAKDGFAGLSAKMKKKQASSGS